MLTFNLNQAKNVSPPFGGSATSFLVNGFGTAINPHEGDPSNPAHCTLGGFLLSVRQDTPPPGQLVLARVFLCQPETLSCELCSVTSGLSVRWAPLDTTPRSSAFYEPGLPALSLLFSPILTAKPWMTSCRPRLSSIGATLNMVAQPRLTKDVTKERLLPVQHSHLSYGQTGLNSRC